MLVLTHLLYLFCRYILFTQALQLKGYTEALYRCILRIYILYTSVLYVDTECTVHCLFTF
jgi:hypothetical protein